jgi:EAL domain-containing protein (putative c-di-GMP-specific phosphodiesterase class I)/GGDEF domain-containing protein
MEQESSHILWIDAQMERAQEIHSQLRNSGINVHVSGAANALDMEQLLRDRQPVLCLLHPSAVPGIPLTRICDAVARHHSTLAILCTPQEMGLLRQALEECACIGVNADDPQQLTALVRQVTQGGHSERDLVRLEAQLAELQERYELLLRSTGDAIAYVHEGLHVAANAAYLAAVGVRDETTLSTLSMLELMSSQEQDLKALVRDLGLGNFPTAPVVLTINPGTGEPFAAQLAFTPAQYEGEPCVQVILQPLEADGSAQRASTKQLQGQDPLTGTLVRHAFMQAMQQQLATLDGNNRSALFYLEPDDSDRLVHTLSPGALDQWVMAVTDSIQRVLQPGDQLCRYSDCTFLILATRADAQQLQGLGEQLRVGVESPDERSGPDSLAPSASLGLVLLGEFDRDAETLLEQARSSWNSATKAGGNGIQTWRPATASADTQADDQHWIERLRYALNNDDFYSVQQAIVNLEGDGEGLFENHTFMHEDDGDQPMSAFLAAAERNDLASTIDRQVIPGLLRAISGSGDRHIINISSNSVLDFSFPGWFERQLKTCDVEGSQVILQLSADAALQDLRTTRRLIDEIAPSGCGFSVAGMVDDRRHEKLPGQLDLAFIKLAPELTHNLRDNATQLQAVRNLVSVAGQSGTQVLAEKVDNSADMASLWQSGVKLLAGEFLQDSSRFAG